MLVLVVGGLCMISGCVVAPVDPTPVYYAPYPYYAPEPIIIAHPYWGGGGGGGRWHGHR